MSEAAAIFSSTGYATVRRWPRYKVDFPVRLIVCKEKKATIFDARGTSLSEGGMALFAGTELRTGDQGLAWNSLPPTLRLQ